MNPILRAREYGQSVWLDYIRRDLLESGELEGLILAGEVCGVTSNPSIFEQAISGSELYNGLLRPLAQAGWSHEKIFDTLAIDDIREATDLFLPLYEATNGAEGFVSIEVDPQLADDTEGTLAEARRLWLAVNRPNVMIKIPATRAGLPAIERATQEGLNINVTLIFSLERHTEVMEAYLRGLEARARNGDSLNHVNSVASFFVSRVDTKVDDMLEALVREEVPEADRAAALRGKIAIANAKLAYAQFRATFGGARFGDLRQLGALPQRPLWASTSTKNPTYPDTYYVDNLIGANTVNTIPPHTLAAYRDHGIAELRLEETLSAARGQLGALEDMGLSMQSITDALEREGVEKFAQSYKSVLGTIRKRAADLSKEIEPLLDELRLTLARLDRERFAARLWQGDPALWGASSPAEEIQTRRRAWMTLSQDMQSQMAELHAFAEESRGRGLKHIVFISLGSAALTLRALSAVQEADQEGENHILDALDPVAIRRVMRRAPLDETLYVVIDQPGFGVETRALLAHFWERARKRLGEEAGKHFVALAGTRSWLADLAEAHGFGALYQAPAELHGGYRALSLCGLLPAVLMGVEVQGLLQGAARMARRCGPSAEAARNPGLFLGAELGAACQKGRRRLTIVADQGLQPLADWVGQLVAEFVGDEAGGVMPIVGEPPGSAKVYGDDRMMLYLRNQGRFDRRARGWVRNGLPVA
ncbi:MAG: bifunctional transaldolase/phosoglucose isomerase, partial [Anaerolineales bacterium]